MQSNQTVYNILGLIFLTSIYLRCGEAGIQFDISKEFQVDSNFFIDIPTPEDEGVDTEDPLYEEVLAELREFDPPEQTKVIEYRLSDVPAFSDVLDDLGNGTDAVVIDGISLEILNIGDAEEVGLDEASLTIAMDNMDVVIESGLEDQLENLPKALLDISNTDLGNFSTQLLKSENLSVTVRFDLNEVPTNFQDVDFDIKVYFDVTLKVREEL